MKTKYLNLLLIVTLLFGACKKEEIIFLEDPFIAKVKAYSKTQLSEDALSKLDWNKIAIFDSQGKHEIVKIPLIGSKTIRDKALYLKVVNQSFIGNYFQLKGNNINAQAITTSCDNKRIGIAFISNNIYSGNYKIYENGKLTYDSHTASNTSATISVPASFIHNAQLHFLMQLLGIGQPGWITWTPDYTNVEYIVPDFVGPGMGGSNNNNEIIEFEENDWQNKLGVDMAKMFRCFDLIPSGPNATFTIILNADLPANTEETTPIVINGNPGHTFLTITKTNGTQHITQNFGFYPASGPKSLGLGNVSSKIVNDKIHEINASIKMDINEASFNLIRANAIYWATLDYNLETNNCADFGINLFNLARSGTPITTQLFPVYILLPTPPLQVNVFMNKSPQMLFKKLNEMKTFGHPEAGNIVIDRTHGTESGLSQGECL